MAIKIPDIISSGKGKKSFNALKIDTAPTDNAAHADYCIVSEFPTQLEILNSDPYTGNIGSQLSRIMSIVELPRYNTYHCYAVNTIVPLTRNEPIKLHTKKGFRHADWGLLQKNLIDSLSHFMGSIIILMGDTPMHLLLDTSSINSIETHRGSIYKSNDFPHLAEVLPDKYIILTYSARSATPRMNPINQYIIMNDINKAKALYNDPTLIEDKTIIYINPSLIEILNFYDRITKQKVETAFDIEATPDFITCFSLTIKRPDNIIEGMSIPLMNNSGNMWTPMEELQIWSGLARILEDNSIKKIAQNGMFDFMYMLRRMNIITDNFHFDTMIAQHICWTDLPKGLDFLTSIYTYHNYYKDESKLSHLQVIKDWPSYWRYNAKDAIYTHEISLKLQEELDTLDADKDMRYMMNLHKPLMEMEWNGVLTSPLAIAKEKQKLIRMIKGLQKALDRIAGTTLNTNSPKQMIAYFYGICMIKPYINRKTGNASCDAVALSRIARKKCKGSIEAKIIIRMRKYNKLVGTYFEVGIDPDNRLRSCYKITGTVSGRLSSEKTWIGTGTNLQNQPITFKKHLRAPEGMLLCEVDLAKAEAHCVAYLSQDANMMEAFESGVDCHSYNASKIFNIPIEKVSKTQRYMGKKVVHASNYGMGPQTFSDNLAKEDIFMSMGECKHLLNSYQDRFPGLARWHEEINDTVWRTRMLYNMFGRPKRFLGIINGHLLRNAYSYIPQSTVAELLNKGSIKMSNDPRLGRDGYDINILTTVHDSDLFEFKLSIKDNLIDILKIIESHMSHTFYYKGRSFTIGLDAKIGTNWGSKMVEIPSFTEDNINNAFKKLGV